MSHVGVVLLDKQPRVTSFAALSSVKRAASTRKVGHTGTLDPFATGLLVALVGSATRTARYFNGLPKRYEATFAFGRETDTDDLTGTTSRESPLPAYDAVLEALGRFRGELEQLPPSYSAVHVQGRRAYEIARAGQTAALSPRRVTVDRLEACGAVVDHDALVSLDVELSCSAGTYVRSIARDLGRAVASAAHVTKLRRTAVGPFGVTSAVSPDELELPRDLHDLAEMLPALDGIERLDVPASVARAAAIGHRLGPDELNLGNDDDGSLLVLAHENRAVAIVSVNEGRVGYEMVIPVGGQR
ncbi:MAG: tRNA pseudouridine(55) synthase TruB [Spirochaetota bacterium]